MAHQSILEFSTPGRGTRDITADVAAVLRAAGAGTGTDNGAGLVHVFVQHTSCSLIVTENADADVRRDLDTILARLAPDADPAYRHDAEGPDDMAAHVRNMLTGSAVTVPRSGARLLLGTWQGIYLYEHRTAPHRRRVVVTVL